ncbi:hypothetical protein EVA_21373 [gut metagenome]|uniref:Uncharacterized protein n=1 Tax=gut metagenome TaxID=749906 RepID=J9F6L0_9ZZZZ
MQRTLDALHREEVARLGAEFATNHVFINAVVAGNAYVVERGLLTFANAHFEVDGVAVYIDFDGVEVVEYVTIVVVEVTDSVFVLVESFVELSLVVNVALLHLQQMLQEVGVIHSISHPRNVAEIIFGAFVEVDVHVDVLVVYGFHAVVFDYGITVAPGIQFVNEESLIFFVFFGKELFGAEDVDETLLVRFFHRLFQLAHVFGVSTSDENLVDLDLFVLVNIDVEEYAVVAYDVLALYDVDLTVLEALLFEVTLDVEFGAVDVVLVNLATRL